MASLDELGRAHRQEFYSNQLPTTNNKPLTWDMLSQARKNQWIEKALGTNLVEAHVGPIPS